MLSQHERVTIAVAYFNLVEKRQANPELVDRYLSKKTLPQLIEVRDLMLEKYTTEEMIAAAEKFGGAPVN